MAVVAMIPIAYALSVGHIAPIPMDPLHRTEIFLSFATTLYGVACLAKLRFTRADALVMVGLFLVQFVYDGPIDVPRVGPTGAGFDLPPIAAHLAVAWAYVALAALQIIRYRREIHLVSALSTTLRAMR